MIRKVWMDVGRRKSVVVPIRAVKSKRKTTATQFFIYTVGIAALGGAAYLAWNKYKRSAQAAEDRNVVVINNALPSGSSVSTSKSVRTTTAGDSFPLKQGSRGSRVSRIQKALADKLGLATMNANGGIDGIFGKGTANALKLAGYPVVIDEATFEKITGGSATVVFNPSQIAADLYSAAQGRNLSKTLSLLQQINSVYEYSSVNEYYKNQDWLSTSKTIVTDLLDFAFVSDESAKEQIKNQFLRIGLKVNNSGVWSLQGLQLYRDLVTIRQTFVIDERNHRIPVASRTILGDEIKTANGMTWFRSLDNAVLQVPTQDVKYT